MQVQVSLLVLLSVFVVFTTGAPTCDFLVQRDGFACALSNVTGIYGIGANGLPQNVSAGGVPIFWIMFYKQGVNPNTLTPIVVFHGGPGLSYDYLDTIKYLACNGANKVLFYDQAYTGRSRPDGFNDTNLTPPSYFQVQYYSQEAKTLIDHLIGSGDFIVLGQSWGAMLSIQFATDYPALPNMKKLIIASGLPNGQEWVNDLHNVKIPQIPAYYQYILLNNFTALTHPDWLDAANYFYSLFFYRIFPSPDCVSASFGALANYVVYYQMWGDGDFIFSPDSTLRHWNVNDKVGTITYDTLTFFGEYDEVSYPGANNLYQLLTCRKKGVVVPGASHLTHIDGVALWFPMVLGWLANPTFDDPSTTDFPPLLTPTIPCPAVALTSGAYSHRTTTAGASALVLVLLAVIKSVF